ncbi:hypothetical protein FIBSPDRAFT_2199 [Athelia psychrophila]|uniref:Uncharacterized protein n=1 Tax=Athelia psychrophila TaxID=1759441 RepID=A0A166WY53_9AGAM|nr:hypothetical protein FIBSPDRAFT_2199 [Fibularhizoctonia sp. CBS 109695]
MQANEGPARLDSTAPPNNVGALIFREALVFPTQLMPTSRLAKDHLSISFQSALFLIPYSHSIPSIVAPFPASYLNVHESSASISLNREPMAQHPNPTLPYDPCHKAPQIARLHPCCSSESSGCVVSECFSKADNGDFLIRLDQAIHDVKGGSLPMRRLSISTLVIDLALAIRLSKFRNIVMNRGT